MTIELGQQRRHRAARRGAADVAPQPARRQHARQMSRAGLLGEHLRHDAQQQQGDRQATQQ